MKEKKELHLVDIQFPCGLCHDRTILGFRGPVICDDSATKEEVEQAIYRETWRLHLNDEHRN
jgi:hypothetical protein